MNLKLSLPDEDDEIDITPMIDCVFLLVLFFMVTSSFIDEPARTIGFSVTLPKTDDPLKRPGDAVDTVSLTLAGDYFVRHGAGEEKVGSLDELLRLMKDRSKEDGPIRLRCDAIVEDATELRAEEAHALKVTLPRAEQASTIPRDQADAVTLAADGACFFRSTSGAQESMKDLETLQQRLEGRPAEARQRAVILRCDARCQVQQFVQVKNVLKLAGVETIFEEVEVRHGAGKP